MRRNLLLGTSLMNPPTLPSNDGTLVINTTTPLANPIPCVCTISAHGESDTQCGA